MKSQQIDLVLKKYSLRSTPLRRHILTFFTESLTPLRQADVIARLHRRIGGVDRVSVYRNLNQLKTAGVLHEVATNSYVFCSHECEKHGHIVISCRQCKRHEEIVDHAQIQSIFRSLKSFDFYSPKQPIFIRGLCRLCSPKSEANIKQR